MKHLKLTLLAFCIIVATACKNDKKESKLDLEDNKQERLNKQTMNLQGRLNF